MEEAKTEEKEGFKAEILTSSQKKRKAKKETSLDEDNYDFDDFEEEIEEDIPDPVAESAENIGDPNKRSGIGESGEAGITVSQSLGVDPSVDSLALEDYDHIEPVEKVR